MQTKRSLSHLSLMSKRLITYSDNVKMKGTTLIITNGTFRGTKFPEFHEFESDRAIKYLQNRIFLAFTKFNTPKIY